MQLLKSVLYALFTFLAATSVSLGDGGVVVLRLPALPALASHADLYGAGLLVLVELFGRLVPSRSNSTLSGLLMRLADQLLSNRAVGGGRFVHETVLENGLAV